jgi:hypothetical protein
LATNLTNPTNRGGGRGADVYQRHDRAEGAIDNLITRGFWQAYPFVGSVKFV